MRSKLDLKGNELLTFALIYGFCMDGESQFKGSVSYITDWLGCDKSTTKRTLQALQDKGLINKIPYEVQGVTFNTYSVNFANVENCRRGVQNAPIGGCKMPQGGVQNAPHIIYNNIVDNIESSGAKILPANTPPETENFKSFEELDKAQPYQWVTEEAKKENSAKERKTLFENSEFYRDITIKQPFDTPHPFTGGEIGGPSVMEDVVYKLEKEFADLAEINVDLFYYFEAVKDWSNSSNTKRTSRGWKSTIRNFVRGDKEKNKLHLKQAQEQAQGLTAEQIWYLNLNKD